ncbi:MAG: cytochrome c1 [Zetaproteobacteria bacterium]|nr:MAG: cytochrome c1 [Zetaproteobacteria bacterium]
MKPAVLLGALLGLFTLFASIPTYASEEGPELKQPNISMDRATLQRGVVVFTETCMGCHSAKYITYRDLIDYPEIGLSREAVDDLRGENSLLSGLITELSPEDAKVSYGTVPPDLSLITRSREGPDYVYSLLTGFEHDPDGRIPDGHYNVYFPGRNIAMPDPLSWLDHEPEDEEDLKEQARTVSSFLAFIGEPHQIQRKKIGLWVMIFLVLFTIVLYALKREVWKDIKH